MGLDHAIRVIADCPGDCDHYDDADAERVPHLVTIEEAISWRKENHLHAWFVDHVNDGDDSGYWLTEVSLEQLAGLAVAIERSIADPAYATEHLPPREGFFFGGTEMDDYYWEDLRRELDEIRTLLADEQRRIGDGEPPRRFAYWCWW